MGKELMNWFTHNAAAIQAIASVVGVLITLALAAITFWYVRLTANIARSSAEQVSYLGEAEDRAREQEQQRAKQTARVLWVIAERTRAALKAHTLTHASLFVFNSPTESDVFEIEMAARQLNDMELLVAANEATVALRHILAFVQRIKSRPTGDEWKPSPEEKRYWETCVEMTTQRFKFCEDVCKKLAGSQHASQATPQKDEIAAVKASNSSS